MTDTISTSPPARARARRRIALRGLAFDAITESEVVETVVDAAMGGVGGWLVTANVDVLRQIDESSEVRRLVDGADLVVGDGTPIVWASRLAGTPLPERVAGSSLIHTVSRYAGSRGARIFLVGGNPGAAEEAGARLMRQNPGLEVVGTLCPPLGFEADTAELEAMRDAVGEAQPHLVFVGLGFPKQERLIQALRESHPTAWYLPCGVSFSFVSGEIKRAPVLLQRMGLEWLHRLAQEPRRLYGRYLIADPPFLARLFADALRRRRRSG